MKWSTDFGDQFPKLSARIIKDIYIEPALLVDYETVNDPTTAQMEFYKYNRLPSMASEFSTGLGKIYYAILKKANALNVGEPKTHYMDGNQGKEVQS